MARQPHSGHVVAGARVAGLGEARWLVALDTPLIVNCVYTGHY